ncbi:unnamed protein product [Diabrotica balteata]|uniref:RRM domain-containing protein n=1 Tax=Diabrotica balteata TaxID=107213 RepID=A0A9N9TA25_DIABA|nr:unnamed protein product [Diabrotica balteata]
MSSQDVSYLKEHLGTPLTLALAEITAIQPRDPIHYLGHWLFKYRYNEEVATIKHIEISQLTEERERLAKIRWTPGRSSTTTKVFVGSLPPDATPDDLKKLFEPYGNIAECDIANKCGFLHLEDAELAMKAIDELNGVEFMGSKISVEKGRVKPRRSGGGPRGGRERGGPYSRGGGDFRGRNGGYGGGRDGGPYRGGGGFDRGGRSGGYGGGDRGYDDRRGGRPAYDDRRAEPAGFDSYDDRRGGYERDPYAAGYGDHSAGYERQGAYDNRGGYEDRRGAAGAYDQRSAQPDGLYSRRDMAPKPRAASAGGGYQERDRGYGGRPAEGYGNSYAAASGGATAARSGYDSAYPPLPQQRGFFHRLFKPKSPTKLLKVSLKLNRTCADLDVNCAKYCACAHAFKKYEDRQSATFHNFASVMGKRD